MKDQISRNKVLLKLTTMIETERNMAYAFSNHSNDMHKFRMETIEDIKNMIKYEEF